MRIADYLGHNVSRMLEDAPFKAWPVEKSFEDSLEEPIFHYVFIENGLELRCDGDGIISVIFLYADEFNGFAEGLFEIPFSRSRAQVLQYFGIPSKSGETRSDPILGEYGAWDCFTFPGHKIHVEYRTNVDCIAKITLMRDDVAR